VKYILGKTCGWVYVQDRLEQYASQNSRNWDQEIIQGNWAVKPDTQYIRHADTFGTLLGGSEVDPVACENL
jgi:hypothetical protein